MIGAFKKTTIIFSLALIISSLFASTPTHAITGWDAGRIIDDSIFTAKNSMSVSQIQSFLNSKVPNCDTYGQQTSEFGGPDLNNDGRVQRWEWGKSKYNQTTFPCLKNYTQGGKKASQIIYDASQKYSISPRVLIVLLQKEQSLVTDTWPLNIQYRSATGYGCPDTAACDSQYYGLTNQIDWAAKMFRAIMDDSPSWYTPYELGNNYIQYNPTSSCDGSTVNIQNRATQALYNYTPYQPNKGALDAGWGSAHCGAYGNRNFFLYFSGWFGRPNATAEYGYSVVSQELFSDSTFTNKLGTTSATISPNTDLYAKVVIKNTGNQVWYKEFLNIGTLDPKDRISPFRDASWLNGARPTSMDESSVAAGENTTFRFKLNTPQTVYKKYTESYGVVIEGQRWLSGSLAYNISVQDPNPVYSVENVGTTVAAGPSGGFAQAPGNIQSWPGNTFYITAKIKNTGNRPLPAGLTKIGTSTAQDRSSAFQATEWDAPNRVAASESAIEPGTTGTFKFAMTTPDGSGAITERFGVLIEGQRWVTPDIITLGIDIGTQPDSMLSSPSTVLKPGSFLSSPNNRIRLILQKDGNLVLYSVTTNKPLWHTRTNDKGGDKLVLQGDGNLVLYTATNKALWHTKTYGAQ
jgi:hypothetical protein